MSDPDDLKARIEAARNAQNPQQPSDSPTSTASSAAAALGHSVGLVVAVLLGGGIGYFVDTVAGTAPFALLVFLVFGLIAGFLNIVRAGKQMAERAQAELDARDSASGKE